MRTTIRFDFNERKAAAAAAVLLKRASGRMEYIKLLKLLYVAERESLRRRGVPIVGDTYLSMKRGPVMETVYTLIRAATEDLGDRDVWRRHVRKDGRYHVKLSGDPGDDALSESEIEILAETFDRYGGVDKWELCELTHHFPEWRDPGDSCFPIHAERILAALGKDDEEIAEIAEETERERRVSEFFNCV